MTEARVVGGRYEIGEVVGYGGMAEVHRGRDVRLDRDVAVKTLRADLARDPTFQSRFRREAQSAASLNHPAIVAIYDTGEDESVPYIVMEYVEGRTLRDVLREEGRLLPDRALEITAEVLRALEYSHRAGIVHRDIKPANVMLTRRGEVKVMDFGIARSVTSASSTMTQTAAVIGTAHYLSPEQARGEHVDARSDIYSAGCLLYELVTGAPPFTGDTPVAVAYQHVREDPTPPSRLDPELSPALDAVVLKALAKNPANRYQTAEEMRVDIERALAGRPVEATPLLDDETMRIAPATTTVLTQPGQPPRGRRGFVYAMLALGLIAVFVAALLLTRSLLSGGGNGGLVGTPDVRGETLQQAQQLLQAKGLQVGPPKFVFTGKNDKGTVIDQDPKGGVDVKKGSIVTLTVSNGVQIISVPPLTNLSLHDARTTLAAQHLKLGRVIRQNSTTQNYVKPGIVISSDPASQQQVPAGSAVTLTVSTGLVQVPDVTNQTFSQAQNQLQQAGFTAQASNSHYDPAAAVTSQSPAANTYALPTLLDPNDGGSPVILVIPVPVPDVTGMTYRAAAHRLRQYGLKPEANVENPDPRAVVTGQSPGPSTPGDPSTDAAPGDTVTLTVPAPSPSPSATSPPPTFSPPPSTAPPPL